MGDIRPLLAERGCRMPGGVRLRTLADVVANLNHVRAAALMDATEIRVGLPAPAAPDDGGSCPERRGPARSRPWSLRRAEAVVVLQRNARGSTADITQARQAGQTDWFAHIAGVHILADGGYQGLGAQTGGQVIAPTPRRHKKALERLPGIAGLCAAQRREHAGHRVRVEHTIAQHLAHPGVALVSPRRPPGMPGSLALAERRDHYLRLMSQGMNNTEACSIVGVGRGKGIRWRYGRTVKNPDGSYGTSRRS
ncbi:hypothetical protein [Micromonospora globbae]|uniref:hypothetical protein n=1 Tax=Micromonospora globbae TaxID=1894969 RepID=UPI003439C9F3